MRKPNFMKGDTLIVNGKKIKVDHVTQSTVDLSDGQTFALKQINRLVESGLITVEKRMHK